MSQSLEFEFSSEVNETAELRDLVDRALGAGLDLVALRSLARIWGLLRDDPLAAVGAEPTLTSSTEG